MFEFNGDLLTNPLFILFAALFCAQNIGFVEAENYVVRHRYIYKG